MSLLTLSRVLLGCTLALLTHTDVWTQEGGWQPTTSVGGDWQTTTTTTEAPQSSADSVDLKNTMNFVDCADGSFKPKACGIFWCNKFKPSPTVAFDYTDPVVMVEVSCVPGKSRLLNSGPMGAIVGKLLSSVLSSAASTSNGKCFEPSTDSKQEESNYFFHARAFGITLMDRVLAARASSRKMQAAKYSFACDIMPYLGSIAEFWGFDFDAFGAGFENLASVDIAGMDLGQIMETYESYDLGAMTGIPQLNGVNPIDMVGGAALGGDVASDAMGQVASNIAAPITDAMSVVTENITGSLSNPLDMGTTEKNLGSQVNTWTEGEASTPTGSNPLNTVTDVADAAAVFACTPWSKGISMIVPFWDFGLLPLFVSDVAIPPCWPAGNVGDLAGMASSAIYTGAVMSSGGLAEVACSATGALDSFEVTGDITASVKDKIGGLTGGILTDACVGSWGPLKPAVGYSPNKLRPVSAALVGYRAYDMVKKINREAYAPKHGGLKFNMDYPYINDGIASPWLATFAGGKGNHGHKGSGCYNVGTPDPRWFTAGEALVPDITKVFGDFTSQNLGSLVGKAKESDDYIFTYWKRTRCCIPLFCPKKSYKE